MAWLGPLVGKQIFIVYSRFEHSLRSGILLALTTRNQAKKLEDEIIDGSLGL